MRKSLSLGIALVGLALLAGGCTEGGRVDDAQDAAGIFHFARRPIAVILEGCALDPVQTAPLALGPSKAVVSEVIVVCGGLDPSGVVTPSSTDARQALRATLASIRGEGYRVKLAFRLGDMTAVPPAPLSAARATALLGDATWRASIAKGISELAPLADGVELDLQGAEGAARGGITSLVAAVAGSVRPTKTLGLFAPPSAMEPSDLPDGDSYDLVALAPHVDSIRLMTLDYSCCGAPPGPSTSTGWAVDVYRLARSKVATPLFVTLPLFGTDFSATGTRSTSYLEMEGLAHAAGVAPARGLGGELELKYSDGAGSWHDAFFEDAQTVGRELANLDVLPPDVGVALYGAGAEDPATWNALAKGEKP